MRFEELTASGDLQAVNHLIGPAVICAAAFDDAFMLRCATCHADCRHNGFGARTEHTEHFASRHQFADFLCQKKFSFVEKAGYGAAVVEKLEDFFSDRGEIASQNGWTARLKEIDVLIAVTVVKVCAFRFFHTHREREVEREVVLNAARNVLLCFSRYFFGLCAFCIEMIENVFESVFRYAIDRLIGQVLQFLIDLLCILPFGNAVAVCHNSPPRFLSLI